MADLADNAVADLAPLAGLASLQELDGSIGVDLEGTGRVAGVDELRDHGVFVGGLA